MHITGNNTFYSNPPAYTVINLNDQAMKYATDRVTYKLFHKMIRRGFKCCNNHTGCAVCTDKLWYMMLSRFIIVSSESLQHHVGGSTGSTVSAGQKQSGLAGQSTGEPNKSHSRGLGSLCLCWKVLYEPKCCYKGVTSLRQALNVQVRPYVTYLTTEQVE